MAHNARDLGCRLGASYFPEAVKVLRQMVERFIEVLDCLDTTFIDAGLLDRLPQPGRLSSVRVGGIDINIPARDVRRILSADPLLRSSVPATPAVFRPTGPTVWTSLASPLREFRRGCFSTPLAEPSKESRTLPCISVPYRHLGDFLTVAALAFASSPFWP